MVYYGILWYIMVYYGILWYIMVYYSWRTCSGSEFEALASSEEVNNVFAKVSVLTEAHNQLFDAKLLGAFGGIGG